MAEPTLKIGCMTLVFLRMEIDHIEDWIAHLHRRGIKKLWIFYEMRVNDAAFGNKDSLVWANKPYANYNLHLSDDELLRRLWAIVGRAPIEVDVIESTSTKPRPGGRQSQAANRVFPVLRDEAFDWAIFLDVDEYLVSPSIEYALNQVPADRQEVRIYQKVYPSRWVAGEPVDVNTMADNYGMHDDLPCKHFFRPAGLRKFGGVHTSRNQHDTGRYPMDPDLIRFHHFRGLPPRGTTHPKLIGLKFYAALWDRGFQEPDLSHTD